MLSATVPLDSDGGKVRLLRSEELVQSIIELIDSRGLRAGDPMPPEPKLMEEFDAARNSVREALRTLQALGIVEIRHGYGTFVGSASMSALSPSLLFRTRARSKDDLRGLRDLLGVRQILETELTRQVAEHPDESLLADLDACVARMHDPLTAPDADRQFHERIGEAAGNDLALELIRVFWDVYRQTESLLGTPVSKTSSLVAKHQLIVDTIRGGKTDLVADAVSHHFDEIRDRIAALRR
jgi:DNA-binding FadR family transcriptional regulator